MKKKTIVFGIGTYAMFDDSIGIRIVEEISEKGIDVKNGFTAIDLSANVLNVVAYLDDNTDEIIFVDSIKSPEASQKPGDYVFFDLEAVESQKHLAGFSTHEGDVVKTLKFTREMGYRLPKVSFMAIYPEVIKNEFGLSESLSSRMNEYVEAVVSKVSK